VVIDLFLRLIDKGIELLREGERRKKQFFEEVVKPIQAFFQKMYDDHIKTFADTRSMLLSEKSKSRDIVSLVEGRLLFEHGTTELLYRLTGTGGDIGGKIGRLRGSLKDDFDEYVSDIAKCLISPNPQNLQGGIVYYVALRDVIRRLSEEKLNKQTREEALRDLEAIVRRFQSFYADVMSKYIELQRSCST
jgi:hypothetical protein